MREPNRAPACAIAYGIAAATTLVAASAFAQGAATPSEKPAPKVERIEVTGTLRKVIEGETALPISVIKVDELAKAGVTNAEQAVQYVVQNQSSQTSTSFGGSGTGFASYANLRSLGSSRTVVLLNGKRIVSNPYQSLGVDLNSIPIALIERIEVLADGASATYGTDAIAGVINFITRKEYSGAMVSAVARMAHAKGGGDTKTVNASLGFGELGKQGWNVYGAINWRDFDRLNMADRDFARSYVPEQGFNRLSAIAFPANYTQTATGLIAINPSAPACNPPVSIYGGGGFGPRSCGFENAALINALPEQTQKSLLVKGTMLLGDDHSGLIEYLRGQSIIHANASPATVQGLTMTSANPYFPGRGITPGTAGLNQSLPISLNMRVMDTGLSLTDVDITTDRLLARLDGRLFDWEYQASVLRSTATHKIFLAGGFPGTTRVRAGIAGTNGAPYLNPFGPQSAAGLQYLLDSLLAGEAQRGTATLDSAGAQAARDLLALPGGPLSLALAVEYKKEESEFRNNFNLVREAGIGLGQGQDISGSRKSWAIAAEANAPVTKGLDIGLSVRLDDYQDVGRTTNPKVSFRYEPFESVLVVRGSYNTGFRAPFIYELNQPIAIGQTAARFSDPVLCPGGVLNAAAGGVSTRDCNFQFPRHTGGNKDLIPEESRANSLGIIWQPLPSVSFGIDYWRYRVEKSISALSEAAILGDPAKYAGLIFRCSQVPAANRSLYAPCLIPGGDPIAYIVNTTLNLGETKTSGYDVSASWTGASGTMGRVGARYNGTYVATYDFQREPGGPFFSRAGVYFDGIPVIRYAHTVSLLWDRGPWTAQINNRYKSGYVDCNAQCNIRPEFFRSVSSYSLWDLNATWAVNRHLKVSAGVVNVLDRDPPFSNRTAGLSAGYDERFVDLLGRTFTLGVSFDY